MLVLKTVEIPHMRFITVVDVPVIIQLQVLVPHDSGAPHMQFITVVGVPVIMQVQVLVL